MVVDYVINPHVLYTLRHFMRAIEMRKCAGNGAKSAKMK